MPISAEREKLYPGGSLRSKEWLEIRERVLDRAMDRCERCGVENGEMVWRRWKLGMSKVVLTISHYDQNPENNVLSNLEALCQKCHLEHDLELHMRNRSRWRVERVEAAGQRRLEL